MLVSHPNPARKGCYPYTCSSQVDAELSLRAIGHTVAVSRLSIRHNHAMQLLGEGEIISYTRIIICKSSNVSKLTFYRKRSNIEVNLVPCCHPYSWCLILHAGTILPRTIVRTGVRCLQPHPIHLSVVLSLPYGQREELLGPGGVHLVAVDGHIFSAKHHLVFSFSSASFS